MLSLYSRGNTLKLWLKPVPICQYFQRHNFGKTNRGKIFGNIITISKLENSIKIFQFEDVNVSSKSKNKFTQTITTHAYIVFNYVSETFSKKFSKHALCDVMKVAYKQGGHNQKEIQLNLWNIFLILIFNELYPFS